MRHRYSGAARRGQLVLATLALMCCGLLAAPRAQAASPVAADPVHLLILGDSLTAGYGLPPSQGFQAKLAAALQAKGADVQLIDGAVSGDTSADAAARLDWVLGGGPVDAAFIELGGNDGLRGLDPDLLRQNLSHILDVLAAKHIPVLLSGIIAPPSLGADYGKQFHAVFDTLGKRPGLIYDPLFVQGLVGKPGVAQADGIHPNATGVDYEVARLLPLVLRLVAEAKPAQPTATVGTTN